MVLLGINCGYGNGDCCNLPLRAVDLEAGWIDYPRPKTGIPRRCPLWPKTITALKEALAARPAPKNPAHAGLVFITKYGLTWAKDTRDNPVTKETRKLLRNLGIDGQRNFYALRHTFRTVADESKDQPAVDFIMGHTDPTMAAHYRERIDDSRLRAVTDHVHSWLFGAEPDGGNGGKGTSQVDPPSGEGDRVPVRKGDNNCVLSGHRVRAEEGDARPTLRLFVG
jgi:integrase